MFYKELKRQCNIVLKLEINAERKVIMRILEKKKFMIGMFFLSMKLASFAMSIGPIYFNQRIDGNGGYQEYEIENESFSTNRYKISVIPETNKEEERNQMKKWVSVYPKVLTVKPKSKGKVKVLIKAGANVKPGEYKFILKPTPIVVPVLNENKLGKASVALKAPLNFSLGLNGYVGSLGDVRKDIKIERTKTSAGTRLKVVNNMKREVALDISIRKGGEGGDEIDLLKIKPGTSFEKMYKGGKKIEVREAPTKIEI